MWNLRSRPPRPYRTWFSFLNNRNHRLRWWYQLEINSLKTEVKKLKEQNQAWQDEVNRLKGEKGKPDFKKNEPAGNKHLPGNKKELGESKGRENNKNHHTFALSTAHVTVLTTIDSKSMMSAMYAYTGGAESFLFD